MKFFKIWLLALCLLSFGQVNAQEKEPITITSTASLSEANPLLIVNGTEVAHEVMEQLNPELIESVDVIKGRRATEQYGAKAKNGVVSITLKEGVELSEAVQTGAVNIKINEKEQIGKQKMPWKNTFEEDKTLVVMNGEVVEYEVLEGLKPEDIATINVYKGPSVPAKYEQWMDGKEGLIEITLKN